MADPSRAKSYSRERHRLSVIDIFLTPAILIFLILFHVPVYLKNLSVAASPSLYINLAVFYMLMGGLYFILLLPLTYYSDFVLEHKYSLSNQTLKDWVKKQSKKIIVSFIVSMPLFYSLYTFIRYWPSEWWFPAAALWFFASILLAKFAPILIVPLFYKYSPIKNEGLKNKLSDLALKAGFNIEGVYELNLSKDTKKANAALMGIGRQKRIVLCDTLLGNFSEDEMVSIMGHELGHHKKGHILKLILSSGISTFIIFFLANIAYLKIHSILGYKFLYDFEALVLLFAIIMVLNIPAMPIQNLFSRRLEKAADRFALEITQNKNAFISTMRKLATQNLADPSPGKFYEIMLYSHPPISKRISLAESFTAQK